MTLFGDYTKRVGIRGNTYSETLANNTKRSIVSMFKMSPNYKQVSITKSDGTIVNNVDVRVVTNFDKSTQLDLLFLPTSTFETGNIVDIESVKWIIVDFIDDDIFKKAKLEQCNNTLIIEIETPGTIIGYDSLGRPIYGSPTITSYNYPCVVKSISELYTDDQNVNVLNGKIALMVQNSNNIKVDINTEFSMYGNNYRVYGFDRSKSIGDDRGLLIVFADKF